MIQPRIDRTHGAWNLITTLAVAVVSALETLRAVRDETRVWIRHLTGEGPATLWLQRAAVAAAPASSPLRTPDSGQLRKSPPDPRPAQPSRVTKPSLKPLRADP